MNLDDELKSALRRKDPPLGFTQRVVARARTKPVPKTGMFRMIWAAGIAAMLVIGFTAASEYRQVKAERAASQAVVALRIAAAKLNMTRDKVLKLEN
jgi:predicted ABC-class ATPase